MNKSAVKKGIGKESKLSEMNPMITRQRELRELAEKAGLDTAMYSEGTQYEPISLGDLVQSQNVSRHYLVGVGKLVEENVEWGRPLTKGVLLCLIQAQKTQRFTRFEIWELKKDPILVGFVKWESHWTGKFAPLDCPELSQVTYKICEWE